MTPFPFFLGLPKPFTVHSTSESYSNHQFMCWLTVDKFHFFFLPFFFVTTGSGTGGGVGGSLLSGHIRFIYSTTPENIYT